MPFTAAQIASGANYTLQTFARNKPVDQVNTQHEVLKWLIANKKDSSFGNGYFGEGLFVANGSNYQNYFGADEVTYNERDPGLQTKFAYFNYHDGFWFDEDRLAANGIIVGDDPSDTPTQDEKDQLMSLLDTSYDGLRKGVQDNLALELLQDGSQSSKACPGLDYIVDTTPAVGVVGNVDPATATYWRNNINLALTASDVVNQMEITWRACTRYGGMKPTKIFCGSAFMDAYRTYAQVTINRQLQSAGNEKGGVNLDASVSGLFFKGIELVWDPTFEELDAALGSITYPWTKRCYFLREDSVILRPMKKFWMRNAKPEKLPNRYVTYFGTRSKYGLTTNKRNCMAVLSIA